MKIIQLIRGLIILVSILILIYGIIASLYSIIVHLLNNNKFRTYSIKNSKFNFIYYGLIGIIVLNDWHFISKIFFLSILFFINKLIFKKIKTDDFFNRFLQKIKIIPKRKLFIYGFVGLIIIISEFNPILLVLILFIFVSKKYLLPQVRKMKVNFNKKKLIVPVAIGTTILLVVFVNNKINDYKKNQINYPIGNFSNTEYYNLKSNNQFKSSRDNRSNQLNPNNNSYYQSRGYKSKYDYDNQIKSSRDNRSNQLNPNNNSYYQSRGYNSTSDYNNQTKASRDNRSNQLNPNNSSYQSRGNTYSNSNAASNNRSNQMNPNNSAYRGGKK